MPSKVLTQYLFLIFLFASAPFHDVSACGAALDARMKAAWASEAQLMKQMRATGDCSIVPKIMAAGNRAMAACEERAAKFAYCGAWCNRKKSAAQVEREVTSECNRLSAAKAPRERATSAAPIAGSNSASCSDITGTNSKSAAVLNCDKAKTALKFARETQKANPARAAGQYKEAAEHYRRAGDVAQANAVLQEAGLLVAAVPNPPAPVSGASQPQPATQPRGGLRTMWSGNRDDCDNASALEQNTAGWYDMCTDPKPRNGRSKSHKPSIDPQILFSRARESCKNATIEAKQRCIMDAKVAILLAEDLAIRSECGATTGDARIVCVHGAYLYGPGGSDRAEREERQRNERLELNKQIAAMPGSSSLPTDYPAGVPVILRDGRCPPGSGMKPTPGAFGAWSCQPLGVIYLARDRQPGHPQTTDGPQARPAETSDAVRAFEQSVIEAAADAVVVVAESTGASLPGAVRDNCRLAAFVAAYSVLKGGATSVSEQCRPMASAARTELAYNAVARIDTRSNPGVEELLSALAERGLGAGGASALRPEATNNSTDCARAETHWKSAEEIKTLAVYEDHLARFSNCEFATLAAARIQTLKK